MPRIAPLVPSDIRANIIPASDLDLQGDTGQPLGLLSDVEVRLALLGLIGPTGPRLAKCGLNVGLLVSRQPDVQGIIGSYGNVWNNVAVVAGNGSPGLDTLDCPFLSIAVVTNAATNINLYESPDNVNFHFMSQILSFAAAGSGGVHVQVGARYISLNPSANATLTGTVMAKAG